MAGDVALDEGKISIDANEKRRNFLKWVLGGLFATVAGSVVYPFVRYMVPSDTLESASSVRIAEASEVPDGKSVLFKFGAYPALLVNFQGQYYCYGAICTHLGCIAHYQDKKGCTMSMDGKEIHCVCHAGHYDVKTGEVLAGPPPKALPKINIKRVGEDIYAEEWESPNYVKTLDTY